MKKGGMDKKKKKKREGKKAKFHLVCSFFYPFLYYCEKYIKVREKPSF